MKILIQKRINPDLLYEEILETLPELVYDLEGPTTDVLIDAEGITVPDDKVGVVQSIIDTHDPNGTSKKQQAKQKEEQDRQALRGKLKAGEALTDADIDILLKGK